MDNILKFILFNITCTTGLKHALEPDHFVAVQILSKSLQKSVSYRGCPSNFSYDLKTLNPVKGNAAIANPYRACTSRFRNAGEMNGSIAILQRGGCSFSEKALNLYRQGAIGGIVIDDYAGTSSETDYVTLSGNGYVGIPFVLLWSKEGSALLQEYNRDVHLEIVLSHIPINLNLTQQVNYTSEPDTNNPLAARAEPEPDSMIVQLISEPFDGAVMYRACPSNFSHDLHRMGPVQGHLAIANDYQACSSNIINHGEIAGKIAIVGRGTCTLIEKARNLEFHGAIGGIVIDDTCGLTIETERVFSMLATDGERVQIPFLFMYQVEGEHLLRAYNEDKNIDVVLTHSPRTIARNASTPDSTAKPSTTTIHLPPSAGWKNASTSVNIKELLIDKTATNKIYRKYNTAVDPRPSSRVVGIGLLLPVVILYVIVFVIDIPRLVKDVMGTKSRNIETNVSPNKLY